MIINKDLKNNDKDISHEYKWGVTSWGDNKTYVIPKKTKRFSIHVGTICMNASGIKLNFLLKIHPGLHLPTKGKWISKDYLSIKILSVVL